MNYDEFLKDAQDTPGLKAVRELQNLAKSFQGAADISRRKGEAPEYTDNEIIRAGRVTTGDTAKNYMSKIRAEIKKRKEEAETKYRSLIEGDKTRPFNISLRRDSIAAMTDSELKILAVKLQKGETDIFDPAEVNIILAAVKNISKPLFEQTRASLIEQDYNNPWKRLVSREDQESEKILDSGQIPIVVDRGHGPEVVGIDPKNIINSIK